MLVKRNPDIEVYKIDYENWKKKLKNLWMLLEVKRKLM